VTSLYYFLPQVLPAFLLTYSPLYLIHLPLYGSGFLTALTFAAKKPTCCLSIPLIMIAFLIVGSTAIVTHFGACISTL
jgi:hypothetical protein